MGIILPQSVEVCFRGKQKINLEGKGYSAKYNDTIQVNVTDLLPKTAVKVKAICDYCGTTFEVPYRNVARDCIIKKTACINCKRIKYSEVRKELILNERKLNPLYWDKQWLEQEYIINNRTAKDIGEQCGVGTRQIMKYAKKFGLSKPNNLDNILTKEFLETEYSSNLKTTIQIGLENNISGTAVRNALIKNGIHIRTRSECMAIYYDLKGGRETRSLDSRLIWRSKEFRKKHKEATRKAFTFDLRKKMSAQKQGVSEQDWDYFLTTKNMQVRNSCYYKDWRTAVFERDDYTCQCCGARSSTGNPIILHAHHIENFSSNKELRLNVSNGITMCSECHSPQQHGSFHSVYGNRSNNREQLEEYLSNYRGKGI